MITDNLVAPFPLTLVIFCLGFSSTLGMDDFLVVFSAGVKYAHQIRLEEASGVDPVIAAFVNISLSLMTFAYFGAIVPWSDLTNNPRLGPWRMIAFVLIVRLSRRLPFVVALQRWIPDIWTYKEALFSGHFGPIGVGALFLAVEARARIKTGLSSETTRLRSDHVDDDAPQALELVWPIVCFTVLASVAVHGLSMSIAKVTTAVMRPRRKIKQVDWDIPQTQSDDQCQLPYSDDEESQFRQQREALL
ncbi:uncharacterized protein CDV56_103331 [Aspergillus thermomutatus]|uniref:Cation/H+ exchanger transmembrane domain-containing protein n=1 Tax=Aspergillus thermomutatus TaxID=41047 RepID=A0A397I1D9_ASPTH|nr:uncharacterized protein CDV56_103331 [Aspergillus thermomutatus]RHZ67123.1 hypothetical protein CDV56_103331 [Aspergillus thermomutatus]